MPSRGPSIDPSLPLERQAISTTISMPWKWIGIFKDLAHDRQISYSALIRSILEDYAARHDIELPTV